MKKIIQFVFILLIGLTIIFFHEEIVDFCVKKFFFSEGIIIDKKNEYSLNYKYLYVQETDDFYAKTNQHLLNIIYTGLNNGNNEFYFFCDYDNCRDDITQMSQNDLFLDINNFIHPYNSYYKLYISMTPYGKITITIDKAYDINTINKINEQLDKILAEIIKDNMSNKDKIKAFHDYIINTTDYDTKYVLDSLNDPKHPSHNATGPLFFNKALCGGYADIMAIYLNRLNLENYRIASKEHIWNFVKVDEEWLHLDLTWDDPVAASQEKILIDKFFLIPTNILESFNTKYHVYDKTIYIEAK